MNPFSGRKYFVMGIIILVWTIYVIRLFSLQVLDPTYKLSAESNSQRIEILYPARGLILDRDGKLLVYNEAGYDLMITPSNISGFDTADFCRIIETDREKVISGIKKASEYSLYKPSVFMRQISSETYAVLQEKMYKFPGFFVQPRTLRKYPGNIAAHVFGYVGEVDDNIINSDNYYQMGDYYGVSGIEKSYENELRGQKGMKMYLVDVHNRIKGSFQDGRMDIPSVVGRNVTLTIDAEVQAYGEMLMKKFRGSIVAIEPSSGEVLALVTSPAYDPGLLVGRNRTDNYNILQADTSKPLFNRALMAMYPPGSTFKTVTGLIALQEKVITTSTEYYCAGGFRYGNITVACHAHATPLPIVGAVQNSCNGYFNEAFRRILTDQKFGSTADAFRNWSEHVVSLGFGRKLGTDMSYELPGLVPDVEQYDGIYGKDHWNFLTVRSLSIGQGEIGVTPLQMANLAAIIANRGFYFTPHLMKEIQDDPGSKARYSEQFYTSIDSANFRWIIDGMDLAVNGGGGGTAWRARMSNITVCGKTGTAENPHGEDHSILIAFATKENPRIAVSVFVENGGFGNIWAAPIASLVIEKFINDSISRPALEDYVLKAIKPEEQ